MENMAIQIDHVSKEYRLGAIGGGTLRGDLQSWLARIRGKEDPNLKLDQKAGTRGDRFLALDDVSFSVKKGERVGIIGHNGAGKSTLLKLLSRVTAPSAGTISYNGRIASMLEVGTGFHPELTGRENVYMNGAILGMTKAEITEKFDDIVRFAEMEKFIDTPVKRYSSGMYVKLAFAVAAHLDSDILIMDEVLAVGDMKFQQKCLGKMDDVSKNEGRTVLYVSHNMNTIRQLCSRCVVLDHGKVIFDGDVDEAIQIYIGCNRNEKLKYIYSDEYHTCKKSVEDFRIKEMEVIGRNTVNYLSGETIMLRLSCYARNLREQVKFRFEWRHGDGQPVGTMLSAQSINFDKCGIANIYIRLNLAHFMPGKYSADIVAYTQNAFGTEQFLDGVYPGIELEIYESAIDGDNIRWYHGPWGHLRLHDLSVQEVTFI